MTIDRTPGLVVGTGDFPNEPLSPGVVLLQKPFTPDLLARKVREVLDHSGPG